MAKANRYDGKIRFLIDGKTVEEIGHEPFSLVIADGVMQTMFTLYSLGKLGPEYECLRGYRYVPLAERNRQKEASP